MDSCYTFTYILLIYAYYINVCLSLTGHVCTRERAENYMMSYNQAFICQERYTTSCGHLDWRRCTRYRIQTCYTPQQKYATKYRQVEECCPGWREDGAGACLIPICPQMCQNGGSCVQNGGIPSCKCQDGYSGDACQNVKTTWKGWYTVIILVCAVVVAVLSVLVGYICFKKNSKKINPSESEISESLNRTLNANGIFFTNGANARWAVPRQQNPVSPSAPSGL